MRIRSRESAGPRSPSAAALALLSAAATCLLVLGACGSRDRELSEAELAEQIEREIPPGPDRSADDRRAAAQALARDVMDLADEMEAATPSTVEPAISPDEIMTRECEQLAAEVEILRRRIDSPATGEQFTPEERAGMPAELAKHEARYADACP